MSFSLLGNKCCTSSKMCHRKCANQEDISCKINSYLYKRCQSEDDSEAYNYSCKCAIVSDCICKISKGTNCQCIKDQENCCNCIEHTCVAIRSARDTCVTNISNIKNNDCKCCSIKRVPCNCDSVKCKCNEESSLCSLCKK